MLTRSSSIVAHCLSKNHIFCSIHERQTDLFIGNMEIGDIDEFSGVADIGIMIGETFWERALVVAMGLLSDFAFNKLYLRN